MERTAAFEYPPSPHVRRHGPGGYRDYHAYRDWLRDEFSFRCVFCLRRELWLHPDFEIDHLLPQSRYPDKACNYDNLAYVCSRCNRVKGDREVLNPCEVPLAESLTVHEDGTITPLNADGENLIDVLDLDNDDLRQFRKVMLDILDLCSVKDRRLFVQLMGFPDNLPDLSKKKPPSNSRPEGIDQSFFAQRRRGDLPDTY